jgi:DNA-binding LytR/AlgR family response regulator
MEKARVIIVEDQVITARSIEAMIVDHGMEVIAICKSGEEAVQIAELKPPDVVIMDIKLQGKMNGIDTAKALQEIQSTPIIYLSDYTDKATVRKAKETHPSNYLAKPFTESDLIRAIEIAIANAIALKTKGDQDEEFTFFKTKPHLYSKFHYNEIIYIEADRAYCKIHTTSNQYSLSINMAAVADQLNPDRFMKIHRSYIVNIRKVSEFSGNEITLSGHKLPVSDQHRTEVMTRLKILH